MWDPSMPWPGTAGGAWSPHWGGYIRLYVRAEIAAGTPFTLGPHANDALDAGNVLTGGVLRDVPEGLWVDLSCDVTELTVVAGADSAQGILTDTAAGTAQITLADPDGIYDPTNLDSPWTFQGRSRLRPGIAVEAFAEVADPDLEAVTVHYLFTGTADSWGEDWTPHPHERRCTLLATDPTKIWARFDRPEQTPAGAGDTTQQRVQRLVDYYDWDGDVEHAASSTVTLAATTLAASGWELLGRTLDDELGVVYFTPTGALRWTQRGDWFTDPVPTVDLGCEPVDDPTDDLMWGADDLTWGTDGLYYGTDPAPVVAVYDVVTDASPSSIDTNIRNVIRASRTGGTLQTAQSTDSLEEFGPYEFQRTDLGVSSDPQALQWATDVVTASAFPRVVLEDVTLRPALSDESFDLWPLVLDLEYVTDAVRIVWAPPDRPSPVEATGRVIGSEHRVTRQAWETRWQLATAALEPVGGG